MFVEIAAMVERNPRKSGGSATLTQSDLANTKTDLPGSGDECIERSRENIDSLDSEPNEIYRFELLMNEMIELEKRVQRSTNEPINEEGSSGDPSISSSNTRCGVGSEVKERKCHWENTRSNRRNKHNMEVIPSIHENPTFSDHLCSLTFTLHHDVSYCDIFDRICGKVSAFWI
ncbi:unnamed protein product [Brassica oleracea]